MDYFQINNPQSQHLESFSLPTKSAFNIRSGLFHQFSLLDIRLLQILQKYISKINSQNIKPASSMIKSLVWTFFIMYLIILLLQSKESQKTKSTTIDDPSFNQNFQRFNNNVKQTKKYSFSKSKVDQTSNTKYSNHGSINGQSLNTLQIQKMQLEFQDKYQSYQKQQFIKAQLLFPKLSNYNTNDLRSPNNTKDISVKGNKDKIQQSLSIKDTNPRLLESSSPLLIPKVAATLFNDYITNGNFAINNCDDYYGVCWWTEAQYTTQFIYGWGIITAVEIGWSEIYNPAIGDQTVIQLSTNTPICIYQIIPSLPAGLFNLSFLYTVSTQNGVLPSDGPFLVYVNNSIVASINQTNYLIKNDTIQVQNPINDTSLQVKFCATDDTSTAAILVDIKMILVEVYYAQINSIINQEKFTGSYFFNFTLALTIQSYLIKYCNFIPGSRILIRSIFSFFLNLDHLWLYIYHKRDYGYPIITLLTDIQNLQNQKWQLFSSTDFYGYFGLNITNLRLSLSYNQEYSSFKFVQIQGNGSSFFQNNTQYLFMNVFLVVLIFIIGNILMKILRRYNRMILGQFSLTAYLLLMLLEGNIESFSYYFTSDATKLFSFNPVSKSLNISSITIFAILWFIIFVGYFLAPYLYKRKSKYIFDNCRVALQCSRYLFVEKCLLNFALGVSHMAFQNYPQLQLVVLSFIKTLCIFYIVQILKFNRKRFQYIYIVWSNVMASFLRILLMLTYGWFDSSQISESLAIQSVQQILVIIYLWIWIVNFIIPSIIFMKEAPTSVKKLFNSEKNHSKRDIINENTAFLPSNKLKIQLKTLDLGEKNNQKAKGSNLKQILKSENNAKINKIKDKMKDDLKMIELNADKERQNWNSAIDKQDNLRSKLQKSLKITSDKAIVKNAKNMLKIHYTSTEIINQSDENNNIKPNQALLNGIGNQQSGFQVDQPKIAKNNTWHDKTRARLQRSRMVKSKPTKHGPSYQKVNDHNKLDLHNKTQQLGKIEKTHEQQKKMIYIVSQKCP